MTGFFIDFHHNTTTNNYNNNNNDNNKLYTGSARASDSLSNARLCVYLGPILFYVHLYANVSLSVSAAPAYNII